jgi:tellurite methyltransferase
MTIASTSRRNWAGFYRWTAKRPPRELLNQVLNHVAWEGKSRRGGVAIDLGFGAGNDSLELLRRKWRVLAIDGEASAASFLARRVPSEFRGSLTFLVAPMQDVVLPAADLIYASYSLPFCPPGKFPALWARIRESVKPGGHFAGQLFGKNDEWGADREMTFHSAAQVRRLTEGFKVELFRETVEEGLSFAGPKHWHVFDVILGRPPLSSHKMR